MRYLKYAALLGLLIIPAGRANAQVRVAIGVGPGYFGPAPVCAYGYYPYAPYACAPYGYYGPDFFANGIFIGAGPWFHGFHRGPFFDRDFDRDRFRGRGDGWRGDRFRDRDGFRGDRGFHGGAGFRGGDRGVHGGEFHGGGGSHGGGFHGGNGGHGGGRR